MGVDTKVAKINGKFVLISAVITGVCTIISSVISSNAGKEKAVNEVIAQTTDSIDINSIDELIITYNQLSTDNINLKNKNMELESNNTELEEQNSSLSQENESLKNKLTQYNSLEENYNTLVTENNSLKNELEQLNKELQELKDNTENSVNGVTHKLESTTYTGKKVSIFDLDTFKGEEGWFVAEIPDLYTDTYGNEYLGAYYAAHSSSPKNERYYLPTYLLDNKYSICEGQIAWPKKYKNYDDIAWIEFYSGNECIYTTDSITADSKVLTFSFDVKGIEKLTIVTCSTSSYYSVDIIYPYLNLVE